MTSRISAKSAGIEMHRRSAFSLVELLVAMAIITILASILIPLVYNSYKTAGRMKTQADFQVITASIEAYRQDFGDIPRLPTSTNNNGVPDPNTGAAILGKALLGPYNIGNPPLLAANMSFQPGDCINDSSKNYVALIEMSGATIPVTSDSSAWAAFDPRDGNDNLGFKQRAGAARVWGPYVDPAKVHNRGTFLLDTYGLPILYFPARPGRIDVTKAPSLGGRMPYVDHAGTTTNDLPFYNADDNLEAFRRRDAEPATDPTNRDKLLARIRVMLGDTDFNGIIQQLTSQETAVAQPFLLWSAGPDGLFGPIGLDISANGSPATPDQINLVQKAVLKCDDVTNFR